MNGTALTAQQRGKGCPCSPALLIFSGHQACGLTPPRHADMQEEAKHSYSCFES